MADIKQDCIPGLCHVEVAGGGMVWNACVLVDVTKEERDVFLRWKKRSDSFVLVRLKAEAVLYASRGVDVSIIAEMVDRSRRTVRDWLASWRLAGLCSVVTGHAGDENAAELTRAQKEQLKETLGGAPSQSGVQADFWDVPALRDVVKILFDVEYQSDSTYQLLLKFCGMSFKLPDPFDKRRDEAAITARMARIRQEVAELPARGWEVRTVDEVRVEHEAETRRMWLPRGRRTRLRVDRTRSARSFFGALSLTSKKMKVYPIEGNQNAEQIILAMARLVRETENEKIAVVLDIAAILQSHFVRRYGNLLLLMKVSNALRVSSKWARCRLLMDFLPSPQTRSMGFLLGL